MGVGADLYMCDVVNELVNQKSSRSLSHLLMSSCCVEVSRNSIFLQDYKYIKLLGLLKREILLMLIVAISLN